MTMTRDEVLTVLDRVVRLKGRQIRPEEVPVQFMRDRIAVVLPAEKFRADERIILDGMFQDLMSRQKAHAFLDFATDWRGLATPLNHGFN